ncbi:MAG: carboxylating nicotinate-nucleotide diphosphorylase, partial [Bacteroidota bacterium]
MDYNQQLDILIKNALQEDIGDGDHSTLCCIDINANGKAVLKIKQDGILAGVTVAEKIFRFMQPDIVFAAYKKDGDSMRFGETAFDVEAKVHTILQCERLALNSMQRMSGIATLTRQYVDKLKGYKTKLLDTRKTTPNFRLLEKEAVKIGGGVNHRFGLYDMIMLKDNHIDYCGGIEKAIEKAYEYVQQKKPALKIEVETRSIEDVKKVMVTGKINRIMLDNFTPELIADAL